MNSISVDVAGVPIAQGSLVGNPRFGGLRYSNDALLKEWRGRIIDSLSASRPDNWEPEKAMSVYAEFRFVRPNSHFGKKGKRPSAPRFKTTKPDLDKNARAIGDCIEQAGLVRNDSQIVHWVLSKRWARKDEAPGVSLTLSAQT